MRQVLRALDAGEPVKWIPADGGGAHRGPALRSLRSLCFGVVVILLTGGYAWLAAIHPAARPEGALLAALPLPRFEQIAATMRPPVEEPALEPAGTEPEALVLVTEHVIEIEAGGRTRLSAHVANDDAMQPETIALVKGLPKEVRLSDGIMIGPGLWMLRPDLLASVQVDAASSASGRHELTLELRSDGKIISTGRTMLTITAVAYDQEKPATIAREAVEPINERAQSTTSQAATPSAFAVVPAQTTVRPARKVVTEKIPSPSAVAVERGAVAARATAKPKVKVAKPAQRTNPRQQSQVTVLSAKPVAPRPLQQPRLVWPGDDPRSRAYSPGPPVFLGGFVPGATPQGQPPATGRDSGWRKRASVR